MATRQKAVRRMKELGVTIYNEDVDGWGLWDVVIDAPDGFRFTGAQTQSVVLRAETKAEIWDEALYDMALGVESIPPGEEGNE